MVNSWMRILDMKFLRVFVMPLGLRFRSPWETDYRVHDVSVFENLRFRRFRTSALIRKASVFESLTLQGVLESLRFHWSRYPFPSY